MPRVTGKAANRMTMKKCFVISTIHYFLSLRVLMYFSDDKWYIDFMHRHNDCYFLHLLLLYTYNLQHCVGQQDALMTSAFRRLYCCHPEGKFDNLGCVFLGLRFSLQ